MSLIRTYPIKDQVNKTVDVNSWHPTAADTVQVLKPLYILLFCYFCVLKTADDTDRKHEDFRWFSFLLSSINRLQNVTTVPF